MATIDKNKRWRNILAWAALFAVFLGLAALKAQLLSLQRITIYPAAAPIDDELMFKTAQSIVDGNWFGAYNWLTLSKHMFFAVWLALLNVLGVPYLAGGLWLYAFACACTALALRPALRRKWALGLVYAVLLWSPYSWAQFTTRVYRDNIFPSLCLLFFAGVLGFALRLREEKRGAAIAFGVLAGLGLAGAWLTREDGSWLLPFALCALALYAVLVLTNKKETRRQRLRRFLAPLVALAVFAACLGVYCGINDAYYGRFIVSDFTSSEFEDAVGAMIRCDTDTPHIKCLVCRETIDKLAEAVPQMAAIRGYWDEHNSYNGWGDPAEKVFYSGGFCWALRKAVYELGWADNAQEAAVFYSKLAADINAACDSGAIESAGGKRSTTLMPFDSSYIGPACAEMGSSFRLLFGFEQTTPLALVSAASEEQELVYARFTLERAQLKALPNTGEAIYTIDEYAMAKTTDRITAVYKVLLPVLTALGLLGLGFALARGIKELKHKEQGTLFARAVLLLGVGLSVLLRVGMVAYIEAVSFQIGTYLLYLASAGPLLLLFGAWGTAELIAAAAQRRKETGRRLHSGKQPAAD